MRKLIVLILCLAGRNATVVASMAQPNLFLFQTNQQVLLAWVNPVTGTNLVLEASDSLTGSSWSAATDAVPWNLTGKMAASVPLGPGLRFFRLTPAPPTPDGMALIPGGSFLIGDVADTNLDGDAAPTNVYVSAFLMDTNLVTFGLWQTVMSQASSLGYGFTNSGSAKALNQPRQPVESVDWFDAVKWCNLRSQSADLRPVYYTDTAFTQIYTNGEIDAIYANWNASGYRLPTEAEWEKAARGGRSGSRFPWGDTISERQANYYVNTNFVAFDYDLGPNGYNPLGDTQGQPFTSLAGSFPPNDFGLYDMIGNLEEWCWDWYDPVASDAGNAYGGGADPRGPASDTANVTANGASRVLRSGAWYDLASSLRCGNRSFTQPGASDFGKGFRCVRKYAGSP